MRLCFLIAELQNHQFKEYTMSEFEKWWEKFGQYEFSTYLTKEQSKIVWKAAIEWTNMVCRKWVTLHENVYSNVNYELMKLEE